MNPHRPHHHKAHWPAIVFAVLAIGAMVAILAFGAENTNENGKTSAEPREYLCEQAFPTDFELTDIEGKSFEDAEDWAEDNDYAIRPVAIDGEPQIQTMDYRTDRINVQVDDDTVTRYCGNY